LEMRGGCCWYSNINKNPLSPPNSTTTTISPQISTTAPLTSNIKNKPLSPPIFTTTPSHLQY
jgi:hypothetical protein